MSFNYKRILYELTTKQIMELLNVFHYLFLTIYLSSLFIPFNFLNVFCREFLIECLKAGFDQNIGYFSATNKELLYPNPQVI